MSSTRPPTGMAFHRALCGLMLLLIAVMLLIGMLPVNAEENGMTEQLILTIDGIEIPVDWENNESVEALKALVSDRPLTVQMSMYGGFEQVGSLGSRLPRNDVQTLSVFRQPDRDLLWLQFLGLYPSGSHSG